MRHEFCRVPLSSVVAALHDPALPGVADRVQVRADEGAMVSAEHDAAQDRPRRENPTDLWARELRLNERENVVSAFVMVMERHEIAEAQEIADEVAAFFAKIEGAVERG